MKKLLNLGLILSASLILTACATDHDWKKQQLLSKAETMGHPINYPAITRYRIKNDVRDFSTTKIELYSGPKIGSFTPVMKDEIYGHIVCYNVDTKNIFRIYTGNRLYIYIFNAENVIFEDKQNGIDIFQDKRIAETCAKAL